jgi:peptidylprolyl isomerase domain and WD repeat-containing protein 1
MMAIMSEDRKVRIFRFLTGKIYRTFDESLESYQDSQRDPDFPYKLDDIEFGRRMAKEREIAQNTQDIVRPNCVFDESSNFIIYPSPLGLKCLFTFIFLNPVVVIIIIIFFLKYCSVLG